MELTIPIGAMSVNTAWKGKRFKSKAYQIYERDLFVMLPRGKYPDSKQELIVCYRFYIKNYALSDTGNMEKPITDVLCKLGYFKDDRYIKTLICEKMPAKTKQDERIEVLILPYEDHVISDIHSILKVNHAAKR